MRATTLLLKLTLAAFALTTLTPTAQAQACLASVAKTFQSPSGGCICGKKLKNVSVTLPRSLKLVAVCGIHSIDNQPIDIKTTKISLDHYDALGNIPFGELFLLGKMTIKGQLEYDPGPAGEYRFYPEPPLLQNAAIPMDALLSRFKLDEPAIKKITLPKKVRGSNCFSARATLKFKGIRLLIGDDDQAGAYPLSYTVMRASHFKVGCDTG